MVSPALGHQLCKCICVYLSSVSAGKTSFQNCNITNHMKNMNKLEDMKFYIRKINAEREELFRILDIDMNTDLNYRWNYAQFLVDCIVPSLLTHIFSHEWSVSSLTFIIRSLDSCLIVGWDKFCGFYGHPPLYLALRCLESDWFCQQLEGPGHNCCLTV